MVTACGAPAQSTLNVSLVVVPATRTRSRGLSPATVHCGATSVRPTRYVAAVWLEILSSPFTSTVPTLFPSTVTV
jgi:hypothetical protein